MVDMKQINVSLLCVCVWGGGGGEVGEGSIIYLTHLYFNLVGGS